ncbi:MAG: ABC transporter ATP-binding protein [Caldilineaceae bacterium]|nr:ABC transporter ATP-binding protein [Caldilineaceae bacterium]
MSVAPIPSAPKPKPEPAAGGTPAVGVRDLVFGYAAEYVPVFDHFDWTVAPGEMWALIGPSGCGKTTLLYLIAGLRQPQAGQVLVDGSPAPRPRASTGLILQDHGLLPWATVASNAGLGLRMGRLYRNKQAPPGQPRPYPPALPQEEATRWLDRLGIGHLADKYPAQLSGGQRQRVAIARTLALRPNLLLMDEPFSALDPLTRRDLQDQVVELQAELGITTILVTHSVEEAAFLGRRILLLTAPPNRTAPVIDNPGAGQPGFRAAPAFAQRVQTLHAHLGEVASGIRSGGQA